MGHFYTDVIGVGRTRAEAQSQARDDFLYEQGHRHDIREIEKAVFLEKVPPKKWVKTRQRGVEVQEYLEDKAAPETEWLQKWKFTIHSHA